MRSERLTDYLVERLRARAGQIVDRWPGRPDGAAERVVHLITEAIAGASIRTSLARMARRQPGELPDLDAVGALHDLVFEALVEEAGASGASGDPAEMLALGRSVSDAHLALCRGSARRARPDPDGARDAWLQTMQHEVGNRLYGLQLAVHALRQRGIASCPRRSAETLERLERGLDVLARAGLDPVGEEPVAEDAQCRLDEVVEGVVDELGGFARQHGASLRLVGQVPPVEVPAPALRLALQNLVRHALRVERPPGSAPWVEVAVPRHAGAWCIDVRANGIGSTSGHQEPLARHPAEASGAGLGLWVAREALASLGATLHVDGAAPVPPGTTFRIGLPAPI